MLSATLIMQSRKGIMSGEEMMRYYIESDGKVFLTERNGLLDLPKEGEIPFKVEQIGSLATTSPVLFCVPELETHPREWLGKDEIVSLSNVSPLAREAVHAGMPRVVVEGINSKEGNILLVKGSRGLTKGMWSLPGGFLRFGETPEQGLVRELGEELGVLAQIERLSCVKAKVGTKSRLHWIMVFYRISISGKLNPDPDEIAEARYFPLAEAKKLLFDKLMQDVVVSLSYSD